LCFIFLNKANGTIFQRFYKLMVRPIIHSVGNQNTCQSAELNSINVFPLMTEYGVNMVATVRSVLMCIPPPLSHHVTYS
jgi:hypothetical protein